MDENEKFIKKGQDQKVYMKYYLGCAIDCPCGKTITRANYGKHKKTKGHIHYVEMYTDGWITDPEKYALEKTKLSARKRF